MEPEFMFDESDPRVWDLRDYENIQKCYQQVLKKYRSISEDVTEITDRIIVDEASPATFLIIDLLRRVPNIKIKDLTPEQQQTFKELIKQMKRKRKPKWMVTELTDDIRAYKPLPGLKLWDWWNPKEEHGVPEFPGIEFFRSDDGKTHIKLWIRWKERFIFDIVRTTDSRANNLIRYLIKEGIELY